MEIEVILQSIGSLGFPIVICIILLKMISDQNRENQNQWNSVKEALNQLTISFNRMIDKWDNK